GIFREVQREIERYYGGPAQTHVGWVTLTAFEPKVGAAILRRLVNREPRITVMTDTCVTRVLRRGKKVLGVEVKPKREKSKKFTAHTTIDATETGDVMAMAGAEYRVGRESIAMTGEPDAAPKPDNEIQDITYVMILKDYGPGSDRRPLKPPEGYDPKIFRYSTAEDPPSPDPTKSPFPLHFWPTCIAYGKLPNNKYMINWPFFANDFPTNVLQMNAERRREELQRAKQKSLQFLYYIQTVLGHPELDLARDEFPTTDGLPFIPYHRESRRAVAETIMREQDLLPAEPSGRPPLRRDAMAIGDYFLDHHHARQALLPPEQFWPEHYPANAPYQIPFGAAVPKGWEGFLVAEKNIGVTHIVNGCTRLQPVAMLCGQAIGAAATMAALSNTPIRELDLRQLQETLLRDGVMLVPFRDLRPHHKAFIPAQRLALCGIVGDRQGYEFEPERAATRAEVAELLVKALGKKPSRPRSSYFKDVPPHHPAFSYVERLVNLRIASDLCGRDPSVREFNPDATVRRADFLVALAKAMNMSPSHKPSLIYPDLLEGHPARPWLDALLPTGVFDGMPDMKFHVDKPLTRWELVVLLDRAFRPFDTPLRLRDLVGSR
ncbi:MAG: FAD-dependent oxidoreductase, partial [bacterium]